MVIETTQFSQELIPGYRVIDKIGEGGMALVYKGLQVSLKRSVAIKILQKKLVDRSSVIERFKRESLIIARLNNPNIIHIIDRGVTSEGTSAAPPLKNRRIRLHWAFCLPCFFSCFWFFQPSFT